MTVSVGPDDPSALGAAEFDTYHCFESSCENNSLGKRVWYVGHLDGQGQYACPEHKDYLYNMAPMRIATVTLLGRTYELLDCGHWVSVRWSVFCTFCPPVQTFTAYSNNESWKRSEVFVQCP